MQIRFARSVESAIEIVAHLINFFRAVRVGVKDRSRRRGIVEQVVFPLGTNETGFDSVIRNEPTSCSRSFLPFGVTNVQTLRGRRSFSCSSTAPSDPSVPMRPSFISSAKSLH